MAEVFECNNCHYGTPNKIMLNYDLLLFIIYFVYIYYNVMEVLRDYFFCISRIIFYFCYIC